MWATTYTKGTIRKISQLYNTAIIACEQDKIAMFITIWEIILKLLSYHIGHEKQEKTVLAEVVMHDIMIILEFLINLLRMS